MSGFGRKGIDTLQGSRAPVGGAAPAFARAQPQPQPQATQSSAHKFDVTPKPSVMLLTILFFSALASFSVYQIFDPRGLTINRIIELGPLGADIFFGILALIMFGMTAVGVTGLMSSFNGKTWITVDHNTITAPKGLINRSSTRISLASISDLSVSSYQGKHTAVIKDRQG